MAHGIYRTLHVVQFLTCEINQGLLFSFTGVSLWDVTGRCHMKCKNARHLVKWSSVLMHVFHFLSRLCSHASFHACAWLLCWGTQHFHLICFIFFSKLRCSYGEYNLLAWHKSHGLGSKVSPTRLNKYKNYRRWLTDTSLPFNFCMCSQASYIYLSNSILIGWTNGRKVKAAAVGSDVSDVYFLWHGEVLWKTIMRLPCVNSICDYVKTF